MKTCTSFIMAGIVSVLSSTALSADDSVAGTRILAGGRNAPSVIPAVPRPEVRTAKVKPLKRTEVLAGGRNAPHKLKQPVQTFQIAPAVRRKQ